MTDCVRYASRNAIVDAGIYQEALAHLVDLVRHQSRLYCIKAQRPSLNS